MTGWQVQALKEAEDARIWEELNAPDPCEKQLEAASVSINQATHFIDTAENRLGDAMAELFGTPMEAKVGSFLDQLQDLRYGLERLAELYGKGERESA